MNPERIPLWISGSPHLTRLITKIVHDTFETDDLPDRTPRELGYRRGWNDHTAATLRLLRKAALMASKYKAEWKEFSLNEEFWKEVLVGRTITTIEFDANGMSAFVLDNGERIYLPTELKAGRIMIQDDK